MMREGCGTYAGYQRHVRRQETPCASCRQANRDYHNQYRQGKPPAYVNYVLARDRALIALARRYPDEYDELYYAEREKLDAKVGSPRV